MQRNKKKALIVTGIVVLGVAMLALLSGTRPSRQASDLASAPVSVPASAPARKTGGATNGDDSGAIDGSQLAILLKMADTIQQVLKSPRRGCLPTKLMDPAVVESELSLFTDIDFLNTAAEKICFVVVSYLDRNSLKGISAEHRTQLEKLRNEVVENLGKVQLTVENVSNRTIRIAGQEIAPRQRRPSVLLLDVDGFCAPGGPPPLSLEIVTRPDAPPERLELSYCQRDDEQGQGPPALSVVEAVSEASRIYVKRTIDWSANVEKFSDMPQMGVPIKVRITVTTR